MAEKTLKAGWRRVKLGEVVQISKACNQDLLADGFDRYVGLEHLEPGDLRIRSWGHGADGVTCTSVFKLGPVFAVPRLLQRAGLKVSDIGLWEQIGRASCRERV